MTLRAEESTKLRTQSKWQGDCMPNLRALANKLQTALVIRGRRVKINQYQSWSDRQQRMVTKFVVCEKRMVENKFKDVTIVESYQLADIVKALAAILEEPGGTE